MTKTDITSNIENQAETTVVKKVKKPESALRKSIFTTISSLGSLLFIVLGTILVIYYVQGYRLTIDGKVEKTGVLMVTSSPSLSNIALDGNGIGRTPRTETSQKVGQHTVEISKGGYHNWKRDLLVTEGRTTPIYAVLYKTKLKGETVLKLNENVFFAQSDSQYKNIFIATQMQVGENRVVKILKYSTNSQFWQNSNSPIIVFDEELSAGELPTITISPEGKTILMNFDGRLIERESALSEAQMKDRYLYIPTNETTPTPQVIESDLVNSEYSISFINDEELLLQTDTSISKYDLKAEKLTLISRNIDDQYIWSIDDNGKLYYLEMIEPTVSQIPVTPTLDTAKQADVLGTTDETYYRLYSRDQLEEDAKVVIKKLRADVFTEALLDKSKKDTDLVITGIESINASRNLIFTTNVGSFLLDISTLETMFISDDEINFVSTSPDDEKAIFTTTEGIILLTFDKESANHVTKLGAVEISYPKQSEQSDNDADDEIDATSFSQHLIAWHESSQTFTFSNGQYVYVSDLFGENIYELMLCNEFCTASEDGDSLFTLDFDLSNVVTNLMKYEIR